MIGKHTALCCLAVIWSSLAYGQSGRNVAVQKGDYVEGNKIDQRKTYNTRNTKINNYYGDVFISLSASEMEALAKKMPVRPASAVQPGNYTSVVIIPKIDRGKNIYSTLSDPDIRTGLSKVTSSFINNGFTVLSLPDSNMVAKLKLPEKATNDKAQAIYLSGADVCIEMDLIRNKDGDEHSVTIILSAVDRNNGTLLAQENARSNAFRTSDYGLLMDNVIPDATTELITKLKNRK